MILESPRLPHSAPLQSGWLETAIGTSAIQLSAIQHASSRVPTEIENADHTNLTPREQALVTYATKLTQSPSQISQSDIDTLHAANLTDQEILDAAQTAAYFAYANRIVLGLGATLESTSKIGHTPKPPK